MTGYSLEGEGEGGVGDRRFSRWPKLQFLILVQHAEDRNGGTSAYSLVSNKERHRLPDLLRDNM